MKLIFITIPSDIQNIINLDDDTFYIERTETLHYYNGDVIDFVSYRFIPTEQNPIERNETFEQETRIKDTNTDNLNIKVMLNLYLEIFTI